MKVVLHFIMFACTEVAEELLKEDTQGKQFGVPLIIFVNSGDIDLVAVATDDQVDIPAPHDGGAMAIDIGVLGVGGAAEVFPDAAGQPDAPAGGIAALDLLHLGVALRSSVPDVLGTSGVVETLRSPH